MKIFLASDHNGFVYKQQLAQFLQSAGYVVFDAGDTQMNTEDDFPEFAGRAIHAMLADNDPDCRAILICGSGQGMCMAANRFKGIRASLCWNMNEARAARNDDNSNVLCLSSRYTSLEEAKSITMTWLTTPFAAAPRFIRRLQQLDELT